MRSRLMLPHWLRSGCGRSLSASSRSDTGQVLDLLAGPTCQACGCPPSTCRGPAWPFCAAEFSPSPPSASLLTHHLAGADQPSNQLREDPASTIRL